MPFDALPATSRVFAVWCAECKVAQSLAQRVIDASPHLRGLGEAVGGTRLYSPNQWLLVLAAIGERGATQGQKRTAKSKAKPHSKR